jgi:hypothetical protein
MGAEIRAFLKFQKIQDKHHQTQKEHLWQASL